MAVGYQWRKNRVASVLLLLLLASVPSCKGKTQSERANAADARGLLDTPFHFLLSIPNFKPDRLSHDSDLFSDWGELSLEREGGEQFPRAVVREKLLRAAKEAGWQTIKELSYVDSPDDLKDHGIAHEKEDLDLIKEVERKHHAGYSCRIWISDDGNVILAAYRFDSH